jgi:hypothetical protein
MMTNQPATETTPALTFDAEAHRLELSGESYPEDVTQFYQPLLADVKDFLKQTGHLELHLKLLYFNTSSAKYLFDLLAQLEHAHRGGSQVRVFWHYDPEVDIMREQGEDFADEFDLPFELIDDLA